MFSFRQACECHRTSFQKTMKALKSLVRSSCWHLADDDSNPNPILLVQAGLRNKRPRYLLRITTRIYPFCFSLKKKTFAHTYRVSVWPLSMFTKILLSSKISFQKRRLQWPNPWFFSCKGDVSTGIPARENKFMRSGNLVVSKTFSTISWILKTPTYTILSVMESVNFATWEDTHRTKYQTRNCSEAVKSAASLLNIRSVVTNRIC